MAALTSPNGKPCLIVGNVDGVRIAGFMFEAGTTKAPTLLQVGSGKFSGSITNPVVLSDIFARTGGDRKDNTATSFVTINSNNVIIDHTWLWRADHDIKGSVRDRSVRAYHGLIVNGDNVIAYGLFVEHTLGDMVVWNG